MTQSRKPKLFLAKQPLVFEESFVADLERRSDRP
jgi:hypothetical protein